MYHYEIDFFVGNHTFTFKCTSAFEAIDALSDLFHYHLEYLTSSIDEYIEMLIDMKRGKVLSFENHRFSIRYVEGEV